MDGDSGPRGLGFLFAADRTVAPDAAFAPGASVDRDRPQWRQLWFRASGLTIELEITRSGDHRRLAGQLIPRQSAVVDIGMARV